MSDAQNLAYTVVQVLHNFGAVATVSGSLAATRLKDGGVRRTFAWLALSGWGTQAASGAAFGAVSYYYYGKFPDISGIAVVALIIKMLCAAGGFLLGTAYLYWGMSWTGKKANGAWLASSMLALIALTAAAFLRWFS